MVAEEEDASVNETVPAFIEWLNKDDKIITREGFYGLIKRGVIPHFRMGGRIFLNRAEVMKAMKMQGR